MSEEWKVKSEKSKGADHKWTVNSAQWTETCRREQDQEGGGGGRIGRHHGSLGPNVVKMEMPAWLAGIILTH